MIYAPAMAGVATQITLTEEESAQLTAWARKGITEQRFAERARIVLAAATGKTTKEIAAHMGLRPATVSKWRTRFGRARLAGLGDSPRPGNRPCMARTRRGASWPYWTGLRPMALRPGTAVWWRTRWEM
jgi:hypothetical protein